MRAWTQTGCPSKGGSSDAHGARTAPTHPPSPLPSHFADLPISQRDGGGDDATSARLGKWAGSGERDGSVAPTRTRPKSASSLRTRDQAYMRPSVQEMTRVAWGVGAVASAGGSGGAMAEGAGVAGHNVRDREVLQIREDARWLVDGSLGTGAGAGAAVGDGEVGGGARRVLGTAASGSEEDAVAEGGTALPGTSGAVCVVSLTREQHGQLLRRARPLLPGKDATEIEQHAHWMLAVLSLNAEKKALLQQWREDRRRGAGAMVGRAGGGSGAAGDDDAVLFGSDEEDETDRGKEGGRGEGGIDGSDRQAVKDRIAR